MFDIYAIKVHKRILDNVETRQIKSLLGYIENTDFNFPENKLYKYYKKELEIRQ